MLWPMLRFDLKDSSDGHTIHIPGFYEKTTCEECYTIIPLINFLPRKQAKSKGPSEKEIYFTLTLMKRGHPSIELMIENGMSRAHANVIKPGDIEENNIHFSLPKK